MIRGNATPKGTSSFVARFSKRSSLDFYSKSNQGLSLSSIGLGMYKGENSDKGDQEWKSSIIKSVTNGINIFDTAIRYRNQRSEKILGSTLLDLITRNKLKREEVFISSKGGLIGVPNNISEGAYINKVVKGEWKVPKQEIYKNIHSIYLPFLKKQLDISLGNLNMSTIDCYFIHNPELAKGIKNEEEFYRRINDIFKWLEGEKEKGRIQSYGIASWNGFRRDVNSRPYLDLSELIKIAIHNGGKDHGFRFIEAPLSIGMPYLANHTLVGKKKSLHNKNFINFINENGLNFITSASAYEGKIEVLLKFVELFNMIGNSDSKEEDSAPIISLPISENSIIQMMEVILSQKNNNSIHDILYKGVNKNLSLYPSVLNTVRSYPGVLSSLCGMHSEEFVKENLILNSQKKLNPNKVVNMFKSLSLISTI